MIRRNYLKNLQIKIIYHFYNYSVLLSLSPYLRIKHEDFIQLVKTIY
jgi:hypothetical protein